MMMHIFRFELRKRVRGAFFPLMCLLFFGITTLLFFIAGGGIEGASATTGDKTFANAPFFVQQFLGALTLFLMIVVAAVFGQSVYQDYNNRTYQLFFTKPISKTQYLGGRFLAAFVFMALIAASMLPGPLFASILPNVKSEMFGPWVLSHYLMPYITTVLPNILVGGAFFFTMAVLTRRIFPVYMAAMILVMGYLLSTSIARDLDNNTLWALLDPFGTFAVDELTRYWTTAEKNVQVVPLSGVFLWNRLLWGGLAATTMGIMFALFRFEHVGIGKKSRKKEKLDIYRERPRLLPVKPSFGAAFQWRALVSLTLLQTRETIKNVYFLVITFFGLFFAMILLMQIGGSFTPHPVTYLILEALSEGFGLFFFILIVFVSGELMWRERDNGMDQITDALPLANSVLVVSKMITMVLMLAFLYLLLSITGMMTQLFQGFTQIELGQYVTTLFGINLVDYAMICVLAIAVQTFFNHKQIGNAGVVAYYGLIILLGILSWNHRLYRVLDMPSVTYSDMNSYGFYLTQWSRWAIYWGALAVVILCLSHLFWVRGKETAFRKRLELARARFQGSLRITMLAAAAVFVGMGSYIYYNTNVVNEYRSTKQTNRLQAEYEQTFKERQDWARPKVRKVTAEVDLFPSDRRIAARGTYEMENMSDTPISRFMVHFADITDVLAFASSDNPLTVEEDNPKFGFKTYTTQRPLNPGERMTVDFEVKIEPKGFPLSDSMVQVVQNGTFINNAEMFPLLGYQDSFELASERTRKKYGLAPQPRMPLLNDDADLSGNYLGEIERIELESTVSTEEGQIAIAPGYLTKQWRENGRSYFTYTMDKPIWNFYSYLSAEYQVKRGKWGDVDLEIYYHEGHDYNLDAMMDSMKDSLAYFSENFSPYQHRQMRIIEFPRYRSFAQAFPNTVPFSESIGFITRVDPESDTDLDLPYYVTAHEVAHQWWAHQVAGANVQGATVLSESLSQYSALMVMKRRMGDAKIQRWLVEELDRYLLGRSVEVTRELPLSHNENQAYIHYRKGSLVFYAIQDRIGEENLNRALATFLEKYAFAEAPYPTSLDLLDEIKAVAPEDAYLLIDDLYTRITLWDLRAKQAEAVKTANGYEVTLTLEAGKFYADEIGTETEAELNELVDIGVFNKDGDPLYLAKHAVTEKAMTITVTVDELPAEAGIDPLNKLIDRDPDDNTTSVVIPST